MCSHLQLISIHTLIFLLVGFISLVWSKNEAEVTELNRIGVLQFGILNPPQSGRKIYLNDEEYRTLFDELLQHQNDENKSNDSEEKAMRFLRRRAAQESISGPKRFSILDAADILVWEFAK